MSSKKHSADMVELATSLLAGGNTINSIYKTYGISKTLVKAIKIGTFRELNEFNIVGNTAELRVNNRRSDKDVILIDADDLKKVKAHAFTWCILYRNDSDYLGVYSRCEANPKTKVLLHRFLLEPEAELEVDHINHNTLDNRRCNLRGVSKSLNQQNRLGSNKGNSTGIRGVTYDAVKGLYLAQAQIDNKVAFKQYYTSAQEADSSLSKFRRHNMKCSEMDKFE